MKLYYYKENKKFHCYTECGENFNIFDLFRKRYELLGIEYNFYKDIVLKIVNGTNIKIDSSDEFTDSYESIYDKYNKDKAKVNIDSINESLLNIYSFFPTQEWLNDGISIESMKLYNIRYSIDENKIIIPHYDDKGKLIGIRARALNQEDIEVGKYMPVKIEGKIYSHLLGYNVYGLNIVKDNIEKKKFAIIAESEKACLQYNTMFGKENNICVAVCGSNISEFQISKIIGAGAEKVLIAFDKEGENWKEQQKYFNKLKELSNKFRNKCITGFIYDSKNLLNLKESPFDRGKEIFLQLYKNAIWL